MCSLEKRGNVYILTFVGESEHNLNYTMFDVISDAIKQVAHSPDAAALVTTNEGKCFSAGLDMEWIAGSLEEHFDMAVEKLEKMFSSFMRLSIPTVAAICGGAAMGAFMMALAHDYRFMTKQNSSELYMYELDFGLSIAASIMTLICSKLQPSALRDVVLHSSKLEAEIALEKGIVDAVFENSVATLEAAIKKAEKLAGRGWEREIYHGLRLTAFPSVVEALDDHVPYAVLASFKL